MIFQSNMLLQLIKSYIRKNLDQRIILLVRKKTMNTIWKEGGFIANRNSLSSAVDINYVFLSIEVQNIRCFIEHWVHQEKSGSIVYEDPKSTIENVTEYVFGFRGVMYEKRQRNCSFFFIGKKESIKTFLLA